MNFYEIWINQLVRTDGEPPFMAKTDSTNLTKLLFFLCAILEIVLGFWPKERPKNFFFSKKNPFILENSLRNTLSLELFYLFIFFVDFEANLAKLPIRKRINLDTCSRS